MTRVAVVGAVPPEAEGTGPRAATALLAALVRRGVDAWPVLLGDDAAVADAVATADVVALIDPRPVHAELARTARLAAGPARLVLIPAGYGFCEIATRACARCPMVRTCRASDRVAVHRALVERAELVVYASPLHCTTSEEFVGVAAGRTRVIPPAGVPDLTAVEVTADAVAFVGADPVEWHNVAGWAEAHPERTLAIHGVAPPGIALPANASVHPPRGAAAQLDAIAAARAVVMLPGHPVPFGIAAAAARRAGRELVSNADVGLASWDLAPAALVAAIAGAADTIADAIAEVAGRPMTPHPTPPPLGRVLLHVHHVGLGDSVNLWALARALVDAGARVTYAVPDRHHPLLADQLAAGAVVASSAITIDDARRDHDLILEVTIRPGDAYPGDVVDERWLQLSLERQPSGLTPMHEQFLSLFARAGHALVPTRPAIALAADELARGIGAVTAVGIDPDRELVVAIHPGAGNPAKRWATDRFVDLVGRLRGRGARVIVVGGPGEDEVVGAVAAAGADLVSLGAPLREVAAVLAAATIVVANDSGLMHVASAVGTPTLGIFGPTSERLWGPTHPYAAGVRARTGADPRTALAALGADEVERAFVGLARKVAAEPPLAPGRRIVASPALTRAVTEDGFEWRGRATVTVDGVHDPIEVVVDACRAAPAWADLAAAHDPDLLAALLAAEVIVPVWSARALG